MTEYKALSQKNQEKSIHDYKKEYTTGIYEIHMYIKQYIVILYEQYIQVLVPVHIHIGYVHIVSANSPTTT